MDKKDDSPKPEKVSTLPAVKRMKEFCEKKGIPFEDLTKEGVTIIMTSKLTKMKSEEIDKQGTPKDGEGKK
jgi:hypothetical protein